MSWATLLLAQWICAPQLNPWLTNACKCEPCYDVWAFMKDCYSVALRAQNNSTDSLHIDNLPIPGFHTGTVH